MIYTIGHSTRKEEDFLRLLKHYSIQLLADVRTIPKSRWNPQFQKARLEKSLPAAGIEYVHVPKLGGLREPSGKSIHQGLKNPALQGYADHMQTAEFEEALKHLIQLSQKQTVAIMCAEADYRKCHRQLTSDALKVNGVEVIHIVSLEETNPHIVTPSARVTGKKITYPGPQTKLEF